MNWSKHSYRIKIGGLSWCIKTGLGLIFEKLNFKNNKREALSISLSTSLSSTGPKILYIHSGWAIETVGRLWLSEQPLAQVNFLANTSPALTKDLLTEYDYIWYGYSSLFWQHPCPPEKAIIAIHDPAELFPESRDWKSSIHISDDLINFMKSVRAVVVISREMEDILKKFGISTSRIATSSQIAPREASEIIESVSASILSVGRIYRRKNFEQFKRIAKNLKRFSIKSYLKCDHFPLPGSDYVSLLDKFPIYVCTSFQEGGPLPIMDAMLRGCVPLSTRVGQSPEIIRDGIDGFICEDDATFIEKIKLLADNPVLMRKMRLSALERIQIVRSQEVIEGHVRAFLKSIVKNT